MRKKDNILDIVDSDKFNCILYFGYNTKNEMTIVKLMEKEPVIDTDYFYDEFTDEVLEVIKKAQEEKEANKKKLEPKLTYSKPAK